MGLIGSGKAGYCRLQLEQEGGLRRVGTQVCPGTDSATCRLGPRWLVCVEGTWVASQPWHPTPEHMWEVWRRAIGFHWGFLWAHWLGHPWQSCELYASLHGGCQSPRSCNLESCPSFMAVHSLHTASMDHRLQLGWQEGRSCCSQSNATCILTPHGCLLVGD